MFLPTESLFAEVLRIPGLFEQVRKDYNVIITGPTTITALLNSLQIGFRSLVIEKRTAEVWNILRALRTEFDKFSNYLTKTREKLQQTADSMEQAEKRTQIIGQKLKNVEYLDSEEKSEESLGLKNVPPI
jgi:DNA recombination protein RmuC